MVKIENKDWGETAAEVGKKGLAFTRKLARLGGRAALAVGETVGREVYAGLVGTRKAVMEVMEPVSETQERVQRIETSMRMLEANRQGLEQTRGDLAAKGLPTAGIEEAIDALGKNLQAVGAKKDKDTKRINYLQN